MVVVTSFLVVEEATDEANFEAIRYMAGSWSYRDTEKWPKEGESGRLFGFRRGGALVGF